MQFKSKNSGISVFRDSVVSVWGRTHHTKTDEVAAAAGIVPVADRGAGESGLCPGAAAQHANITALIGIDLLRLVNFV